MHVAVCSLSILHPGASYMLMGHAATYRNTYIQPQLMQPDGKGLHGKGLPAYAKHADVLGHLERTTQLLQAISSHIVKHVRQLCQLQGTCMSAFLSVPVVGTWGASLHSVSMHEKCKVA